MGRALLFAGTGVAWLTLWIVSDPAHQTVASMQQWPNVLGFSGALLMLAVVLVAFGRMVSGRWVERLATIAGVMAGLMSAANVVEDGLRVEPAFVAFVSALLALDVTLAALALTIGRAAGGRRRLLALIPGATLAGILLFPVAGGPIMLVAWLGAAAASLAPGMRGATQIDAAPRPAAAP